MCAHDCPDISQGSRTPRKAIPDPLYCVAFPGCWGVDGGSQVKAACAVRGREGLGSRTDLGYFPCDPG